MLAGMIHCCGVLKPEFTSLIPYALDLYRPHEPLDDVVAKFARLFSRRWRVHFLGLWDTVKAFGAIWPKSLPHLRFNLSVDVVRHAKSRPARRCVSVIVVIAMPSSFGAARGDVGVLLTRPYLAHRQRAIGVPLPYGSCLH